MIRYFLVRRFTGEAESRITRHKISCREPTVHATQDTLATADTPSANGRLARGQLHRLVRPSLGHINTARPIVHVNKDSPLQHRMRGRVSVRLVCGPVFLVVDVRQRIQPL